MGAAASLIGGGLSAGANVAEGYAKQEDYAVKAENYLLEGRTKATNYELEANAKEFNSLAEGRTKAANYLFDSETRARNAVYEGGAKKISYGLEAARSERDADHADRAADFGRLQASLTDASMNETLNSTLGHIQTIRAAGGIDATSPTGQAIAGHETKLADRKRQIALLGINSQVAEDEASAVYLRESAKFSLAQGLSAEEFGKYTAETSRLFGGYNAAVSEKMGEFNANVAKTFGEFNAQQARQYADTNAASARKAGASAKNIGWLKGGASLFGAIGKATGGEGKAA